MEKGQDQMRKAVVVILTVFLLFGVVGCKNQEEISVQDCDIPQDNLPKYVIPMTGVQGTDETVLTNYDVRASWQTENGTECSVEITLPALNPDLDFAEEYNRTIENYTNDLLDYLISAAEAAMPSNTVSVSYEAYFNEDLLSILITEQFASGQASYQVATFDLEEGKKLETSELASRLLGLDYPSFLLAGNAFVWRDFIDRYAETEPDTTRTTEIFNGIQNSIPLDTYNLYNRKLFINESGNVMLLFQRVLLSEDWQYGLESEEYISQIKVAELDWTPSSQEKSMDTLLTLPVSGRRYYPEYYSYLLQNAFLNDPRMFIQRLSLLDADSIEIEIDYINYAAWGDVLTEITVACTNLLSDESLLPVEKHVVEKIYANATKH